MADPIVAAIWEGPADWLAFALTIVGPIVLGVVGIASLVAPKSWLDAFDSDEKPRRILAAVLIPLATFGIIAAFYQHLQDNRSREQMQAKLEVLEIAVTEGFASVSKSIETHTFPAAGSAIRVKGRSQYETSRSLKPELYFLEPEIGSKAMDMGTRPAGDLTQVYLNVHFVSNVDGDVTYYPTIGVAATPASNVLVEKGADAVRSAVYRSVEKGGHRGTSILAKENAYFTIFGPPMSPKLYSEFAAGKTLLYFAGIIELHARSGQTARLPFCVINAGNPSVFVQCPGRWL